MKMFCFHDSPPFSYGRHCVVCSLCYHVIKSRPGGVSFNCTCRTQPPRTTSRPVRRHDGGEGGNVFAWPGLEQHNNEIARQRRQANNTKRGTLAGRQASNTKRGRQASNTMRGTLAGKEIGRGKGKREKIKMGREGYWPSCLGFVAVI